MMFAVVLADLLSGVEGADDGVIGAPMLAALESPAGGWPAGRRSERQLPLLEGGRVRCSTLTMSERAAA